MFATGTLGEKYTCPFCSTPEEKVKFYTLGKAGDPVCPKCGRAHNALEHLRLKSFYQGMEEEEMVADLEGGEEMSNMDDAVVLEDTSELGGDEVLAPEAIEKADGEQ